MASGSLAGLCPDTDQAGAVEDESTFSAGPQLEPACGPRLDAESSNFQR